MLLTRHRIDVQTPTIASAAVSYFGGGRRFGPGVYRIRYHDGAMLYAGGPPLWSTADPLTAGNGFYFRAPDVGVQAFCPQVLNGSGRGQVYNSEEECRAAHLLLGPIDLVVPAPSRLGVYLSDDPYWDNTSGTIGSPAWWFVGRVGDVPQAPPIVPEIIGVAVNETIEGCLVTFYLSRDVVSVDHTQVLMEVDGVYTSGALDELAGDTFSIRLDNVFPSQVIWWLIDNPATTIQFSTGTLQEPWTGPVPYP